MVQVVLPNDTNPLGNVLGGRMMHWIDLVGAIVAYRHCRRPVVTASMDRLDFHHPIRVGEIVILKAFLIYVGRTSMEVMVDAYAEGLQSAMKKTSTARLTYVAIDAHGLPTGVPGLRLRTKDERRRFREASSRRKAEGRM